MKRFKSGQIRLQLTRGEASGNENVVLRAEAEHS